MFVVNNFTLQYFDIFSVCLDPLAEVAAAVKKNWNTGICRTYLAVKILFQFVAKRVRGCRKMIEMSNALKCIILLIGIYCNHVL